MQGIFWTEAQVLSAIYDMYSECTCYGFLFVSNCPSDLQNSSKLHTTNLFISYFLSVLALSWFVSSVSLQ